MNRDNLPEGIIKPGPIRPKPEFPTIVKPCGNRIFEGTFIISNDLSLDHEGFHLDLDKTYEMAIIAIDKARRRVLKTTCWKKWNKIEGFDFDNSQYKQWHFWKWIKRYKFKKTTLLIQKNIENTTTQKISKIFELSGLSLS